MKGLIDTLDTRLRAGERLVAATIVSKHGSAPRSMGSKMLIHPDGSITGTIGGGQLEGKTMAQAAAVFESGQPRLLRFTLDGATAAGSDMICGGNVEVVLERIDPDETTRMIFEELGRRLPLGETCLLLTPLGPRVDPGAVHGSKRLLLQEGTMLGEPLDEETRDEVLRVEKGMQTPRVLVSRGQLFLLEYFVPPDTLYLVGAGHVSRPTAQMAAMVDFHVVVMDDRGEFANRERFPQARELIILDSYKECFTGRQVGPSDSIVIVTRGHMHDIASLEQALRTSAGYVGMIGSRRKVRAVFDQLFMEGVNEQDLQRVYSPIGLDIGAETPEEIAVSIVAELVASRAARKGRSLKGILSGHPLREQFTPARNI